MPVDYVRFTIEILDEVYKPIALGSSSLGLGWQTDLALTRMIGDLYFNKNPDLPLKVPSVVVQDEWNVLFTPAFAMRYAKIVEQQPIGLDPRLWS